MKYINPAEVLEGEILLDVWLVEKKVTNHPLGTGGHFSVGYEVVNKSTGQKGFLKALDFTSAFQAKDFARKIEELTAAYNFERDLLAKCKGKKMRRVLTPLADGVHTVINSPGPLKQVHYLIFDLATGDIRSFKASLLQFDLAWCIRSLHHSAIGLRELHSQGIVHQDLKPSNVLTFTENQCKLTDLGRAFDKGRPSAHDSFTIPGDHTYAPPDLFYGANILSGINARKANDIYALGNLIFFHFTGISATQGLFNALQDLNAPTTDSFEQDLPLLHSGFHKIIIELEAAVLPVAGEITTDIVEIARELCNPDPRRRGDPRRLRHGHISPYSTERYISKFGILAKRVEMKLF